MKEYTIQTTIKGRSEFTFKGFLLAEATAKRDKCSKCTKLRLYRTETGKMVVEQLISGTPQGDLQNYRVYRDEVAFLRRERRTSLINTLIAKSGLMAQATD